MTQEILCRLDELEDPGSRGMIIQSADGGRRMGIFLVRKGNAVFAYINQCPHTGIPLEWLEHQFLDFDKHYIQCATHGALFRVQDGYCMRGPCAGDSLSQLSVQLIDGSVVLDGWRMVDE